MQEPCCPPLPRPGQIEPIGVLGCEPSQIGAWADERPRPGEPPLGRRALQNLATGAVALVAFMGGQGRVGGCGWRRGLDLPPARRLYASTDVPGTLGVIAIGNLSRGELRCWPLPAPRHVSLATDARCCRARRVRHPISSAAVSMPPPPRAMARHCFTRRSCRPTGELDHAQACRLSMPAFLYS